MGSPAGTGYASLIHDVTDSLGADTPPVSSSPSAGFTLHRVTMGRQLVLVKVFSAVPQGSLTIPEGKEISKAFLNELGTWKFRFHSDHFARVIGHSEYADSILPSLVYEQTILAKEHVRETKDIPFLDFIQRITKGVEILHRNNVAHGDIRADNILVGADGLPRISDYGLSRIVCLLDKHRYRGKTDVTPVTRWTPPELIDLADEVPFTPSKEGDIWSLGMAIFELWSGNMPYLGTPLEKVPRKISRGEVPPSPTELRPDLEKLRDEVTFLCVLCWQKNPTYRKTVSDVLLAIEGFINRKGIALINEELARRTRQPNLARRDNAPQSSFGAGSISSSDTTSQSSPTHMRNAAGPSNGSDSGYETIAEAGSSREHGVKLEELEEDGSVASWSRQNIPREESARHPSASQPAQSAQPPPNSRSQRQSRAQPPFSAFPPPPSPNSPLGSINSWMTALLNCEAKHKLAALSIERDSEGHDHQPTFTTICKVNGMEYARCTDFKRKGADEKAAQETLTRLCEENSEMAAELSPSYLPVFNAYLVQHGLENRVKMRHDMTGEDHIPTWKCTIYRDRKKLCSGDAPTKQKATEVAVRNAASKWHDR